MTKKRRHHNNTGRRQIQRGKLKAQAERLARKLGIPPAPTEPRDPHELDPAFVRRAPGDGHGPLWHPEQELD